MSENNNNPPNPEPNNDANILKQEEEFARMVTSQNLIGWEENINYYLIAGSNACYEFGTNW